MLIEVAGFLSHVLVPPQKDFMICSKLFTSLLHRSLDRRAIVPPLTLVPRCLSCPPEKAADSLWTDDKVLQGRVQSWGLLCCSESRGLTVGPPFLLPPLGAGLL